MELSYTTIRKDRIILNLEKHTRQNYIVRKLIKIIILKILFETHTKEKDFLYNINSKQVRRIDYHNQKLAIEKSIITFSLRV